MGKTAGTVKSRAFDLEGRKQLLGENGPFQRGRTFHLPSLHIIKNISCVFGGSPVCFFLQNIRKCSEATENRDDGGRLMILFLFLQNPLMVAMPNSPHSFMPAVIPFDPKVHFLLLFFLFLLERTDVGVGVPSSDLLLRNPLGKSEMGEHRHRRKLIIE